MLSYCLPWYLHSTYCQWESFFSLIKPITLILKNHFGLVPNLVQAVSLFLHVSLSAFPYFNRQSLWSPQSHPQHSGNQRNGLMSSVTLYLNVWWRVLKRGWQPHNSCRWEAMVMFSVACVSYVHWSSVDVMFKAYKQTWCFIGPICWRDHSLLCNFKIWEYLFGMIVQVRVVFRKTDVGDWRFNYLNGSHLPLTLNTTTAQAVKTAVTNNSLSKDYPHPNDHAKQITDTPGFKPFTTLWESSSFEKSI